MDIFFVISGYLISLIIFRSLADNRFSFTEFYFHRVKRIFPALIMVASTCYAAGWMILLPDEFKQLGKHIAAGMGFIQNFILWKEAGYFDIATELKPLMHLWSLAVEEQFYLIYPLLIWAAWKTRLNILTGIIILAALSYLLNRNGIHNNPTKTFFAPQTRFWELMAGSILAYAHEFANWRPSLMRAAHSSTLTQKPFKKPFSDLLSSIGLALIAYSIIVYDHTMPYPGNRAIAPVLGAALLILGGPHAWLNSKILANKAMIWIGLISYPLYLWHWPLLSFARIIVADTPSDAIKVSAVAASFLLATLTYYIIEKRVRHGGSTKTKVVVLCSLAASLGYLGYHTYLKNGLDFRFPKIIKDLTSTPKYDVETAYREGTCFLRPEQDQSAFVNCHSENTNRQSIFIWGDSHAAHLYPGIKQRYGSEYNIIQRTASGCPPILDLDIKSRTHCKSINAHTFQEIKEIHPEHIFMAATWTKYDLFTLNETIHKLKSIGIQKITIIGPVPQWKDSLPKQLYLFYKSHLPHTVPQRMHFGLEMKFSNTDKYLEEKLKDEAIQYISAKKILCNAEGCLTLLGNTADDLTAWDDAHLTKSGSTYLVSRFPELPR